MASPDTNVERSYFSQLVERSPFWGHMRDLYGRAMEFIDNQGMPLLTLFAIVAPLAVAGLTTYFIDPEIKVSNFILPLTMTGVVTGIGLAVWNIVHNARNHP